MTDTLRAQIRAAIRAGHMERAWFLVGVVVLYRIATGELANAPFPGTGAPPLPARLIPFRAGGTPLRSASYAARKIHEQGSIRP